MHATRTASAALILAAATACSPNAVIINKASDALSESGSGTAWSGDEDPELVRDAMPFALKTMESLRESNPKHVGLHLALASGFTKYAYAFVKEDADRVAARSFSAGQVELLRTRRLYRRAHNYALMGLDLVHAGFSAQLKKEPHKAAARITRAEYDLAYWCAVSLAAEISLSKDRPEVVAELPAVGAIMEHLLKLDESFDHGAVHSFMVNYESRGASMGGSMERAKKHFDRAVELTGGNKAGPYVTWAEAACVPAQDMACFTQMLDKAAAVDVDRVPGWRLENIVSQRRAAWLRTRAEELIDVPTADTEE